MPSPVFIKDRFVNAGERYCRVQGAIRMIQKVAVEAYRIHVSALALPSSEQIPVVKI